MSIKSIREKINLALYDSKEGVLNLFKIGSFLIATFILSALPLNPGAIKNTNAGINISITKIVINKHKINKLNTLVANLFDWSSPFANSEA